MACRVKRVVFHRAGGTANPKWLSIRQICPAVGKKTPTSRSISHLSIQVWKEKHHWTEVLVCFLCIWIMWCIQVCLCSLPTFSAYLAGVGCAGEIFQEQRPQKRLWQFHAWKSDEVGDPNLRHWCFRDAGWCPTRQVTCVLADVKASPRVTWFFKWCKFAGFYQYGHASRTSLQRRVWFQDLLWNSCVSFFKLLARGIARVFLEKFSMTFSVFWSNSTVPLLVEVSSSDQRQLHKTCNLAQPFPKIVSAMVFKKMDMIGYVSVRWSELFCLLVPWNERFVSNALHSA